MKNMKRILLTMVAALLLVVMSVAGTLAYLVSTTQTVNNTFTVGNVNIELDEAKVQYDAATNKYTELTERTKIGNEYKILPGVVIAKDPTVTVKANSENCYVRAMITVTSNQLADELMSDGESWININNAYWQVVAVTTTKDEPAVYTTDDEGNKTYTDKGEVVRVYEVRYIGNGNPIVVSATTDNVLTDIFTTITVPGTIDEVDVQELATVKIDVVAHAIQSNGFNGDVNAAWTAYDKQQ